MNCNTRSGFSDWELIYFTNGQWEYNTEEIFEMFDWRRNHVNSICDHISCRDIQVRWSCVWRLRKASGLRC